MRLGTGLLAAALTLSLTITIPALAGVRRPGRAGLLALIPEKAQAALLIKGPAVAKLMSIVTSNKALRKELSSYLRQRIGADLTRIKQAAIFSPALSRQRVGILLRASVPLALKGKKLGNQGRYAIKSFGNQRVVFATLTKNTLIVGDLYTVRDVLAVQEGRQKPINKGSKLAPLLALVRGRYYAVAALDASALPAGPRRRIAQMGLRSLTASLSQKPAVELVLNGPRPALKMVKRLLTTTLAAQLNTLKRQKRLLEKKNTPAGLMGIVSYHTTKRMLDRVKIKLRHKQLVIAYRPDIAGAALAASTVGILAAIAIPAFIKYLRKAKTVEATEGLDKIKVGAKSYFQADHYDAQGNLLPKQFPKSVGWTPSIPCCKQPGGKNKCAAKSAQWNHNTWRSLMFQIVDSHYYQFRFQSSGIGKKARYVIEARGDLDCDGIYSSYKLIGKVDAQYGVRALGPIITNELE
jgi:type IV pilus assembly protein PilA